MDERTLDLNFRILAQPKSGSTWLVHMLSSFIDENYTFQDLEKYIPITDTKKLPHRIHHPAPDPNCKNVKILRNPFDTIVSWNNYVKLRGGKLSKSIPRFNQYYEAHLEAYTLVVRYEDLNMDTHNTLREILDFLNWNFSDSDIDKVVNKCSFKNLQQYEEYELKKHSKFLFYDTDAQLNKNKRFYNKGECYSFKDHLSNLEIKRIYNMHKRGIKFYWPEIEDMIDV